MIGTRGTERTSGVVCRPLAGAEDSPQLWNAIFLTTCCTAFRVALPTSQSQCRLRPIPCHSGRPTGRLARSSARRANIHYILWLARPELPNAVLHYAEPNLSIWPSGAYGSDKFLKHRIEAVEQTNLSTGRPRQGWKSALRAGSREKISGEFRGGPVGPRGA